jgi:hypothetical protein
LIAPIRTKFIKSLLLVGIISVSIWGVLAFFVSSNARAILVSPRIGSAIQGSPSYNPGTNTTNFLELPITVWVAPDPSESPIPREWLNKNHWSVALIPAYMPTADCLVLKVEDVITGQNTGVLFGSALDTGSIIPTAVGLVCSIPADAWPVMYHLAVGFRTPITPERQRLGEIDLIPKLGSWMGPLGSASSGLFGSSPAFLLTEPCAVNIPWIEDARSWDKPGIKTSSGHKVNPFTVLQITDTHYAAAQSDWMAKNALWEEATAILAPDLIILTGDLIENPREVVADYATAYNRLVKLGLPLMLTSGNHDQYNLGPWRHVFGAPNMVRQYDNLGVVLFDNVLPMNTGVLNWVQESALNLKNDGPVFLAAHYPLVPDYFQSGWLGIIDMMIQNNFTAYLAGHYHSDFIGDLAVLRAHLLELGSVRKMAEYVEVAGSPTQNYLQPISTPQLLLTRSSGKSGNSALQDYLTANFNGTGYRKFTLVNDLVVNYTYDLNGDGIRDPQICTPNGYLRANYTYEPNLGVDLGAGAWGLLNNSLTEEIPAARMMFTMPKAPAGYHWGLTSSNKSNGIYIRTFLSNSTHTWFDVRVPASRNSLNLVKLELVLGDG